MNALVLLTLLLTASRADLALAEDFSQFNGSDGFLHISADSTIDLSAAQPGIWTDINSGNGVYDSAKWAVVFHYDSVQVDNGATLRFDNHPSAAPVVWLVRGPVNVEGLVNLNGWTGHSEGADALESTPGPGGFRGGRGSRTSAAAGPGYGPGGANTLMAPPSS